LKIAFKEFFNRIDPKRTFAQMKNADTRVARKDSRLTETFVVERIAKGVATVKPGCLRCSVIAHSYVHSS